MKNIIFFVDAQKGPSGGGKIIYQYSNYIDSLKNFKSSVAHLEKKKIYKWINSINKKISKKKNTETGWKFKELRVKKNHNFTWFDQKIKNKEDFNLSKNNDFVVLPEIFAHFAEDFLIKEKIPYAIFVQNGYAIFPTNNIRKLNLAYEKAKFILAYSQDIKECIALAYPTVKNKILNVKYSIDYKKFNFKIKKENLITYMPRKLSKHSELIISFLNNSLPNNWRIKAIDNSSEKEVYRILEKSKFFLAFSNLEGLPLPPIEAALSGNKVIGYTGEGGKEYWKEPIFTEIKTAELKNFCKKILLNLNLNFNVFLKKTTKQRKKISVQFSVENEKKHINRFLKKI
jgi:hypothetical protein